MPRFVGTGYPVRSSGPLPNWENGPFQLRTGVPAWTLGPISQPQPPGSDALDESADDAINPLKLGEEAIMAHGRGNRFQPQAVAQVPGEVFLLVNRVKNVSVNADDERGDNRCSKRFVHASATAADVMAVECVGERDIRPSVKAARQFLCLVVEVALYLETALAAHGTQRIFTGLRGSPEPVIQF